MEAKFLGRGGITQSVIQGVSEDELPPQVSRLQQGGNDHLVFTTKKETRLQLCHFEMVENTKFRLYFLSSVFSVLLVRRSVRGNRVDKVGVGGAPDKCGGLYLS